MNFPPAVMVPMKDIFQDDKLMSVRTVGKLKEYDLSSQWAILEYQKYSIKVDTKYLGDFKHIIGNYYAALGEIIRNDDNHQPILRARHIRNVQGLDLSMYEHVLTLRKQFLDKITQK